MRIVADQDALARMVARYAGAHHATAIDAARRIVDATPKASDDAAGVSIATRMQARAASAVAAAGNVQDGISLMQVSEGALSAMTAYLDQIRTIAVQAGNDTFGDDQRRALQVGVDGLLRSFDETLRSVSQGHRTIQVGLDAGDTLDVPTGPVGQREWDVSVLTAPDARSALDALDEALAELHAQRAAIGAAENRLRRVQESLGAHGDRAAADGARLIGTDLGREVVTLLTARTWAQLGAQMLGEVIAAGRRAAELLVRSAPDPAPASASADDTTQPEGRAGTLTATPVVPPPAPVVPTAPSPAPRLSVTSLVPEPFSPEMPSAPGGSADRTSTTEA